jgi:hypothetical protein
MSEVRREKSQAHDSHLRGELLLFHRPGRRGRTVGLCSKTEPHLLNDWFTICTTRRRASTPPPLRLGVMWIVSGIGNSRSFRRCHNTPRLVGLL